MTIKIDLILVVFFSILATNVLKELGSLSKPTSKGSVRPRKNQPIDSVLLNVYSSRERSTCGWIYGIPKGSHANGWLGEGCAHADDR